MIYKGESVNEISFPLGGIGTGSIGISGDGRLVDWEIFNRPSKGSINRYTHIAIKAETPSGLIVKVLNGDMKNDLSGRHKKEYNKGVGLGVDGCNDI